MNKTIYAIINNTEYVFTSWKEYHAATFNPENVPTYTTDFRITGSDYASRKAAAREIAVDISLNQCGGLSWNECALLANKLETIGKRYGLLEELRENGLI